MTKNVYSFENLQKVINEVIQKQTGYNAEAEVANRVSPSDARYVDSVADSRARLNGRLFALPDILTKIQAFGYTTKAEVSTFCDTRRSEFPFVEQSGWKQVDGHGVELNFDYGRYLAYEWVKNSLSRFKEKAAKRKQKDA
jgi:hypothetical protein